MMKNRNLDNLNIYALRLYARKFGVKAPTSKKKKDLIQEIVKIQNGEKLPEYTNKGRKPLINFFEEDKENFNEKLTTKSSVESVINIDNKEDFILIFKKIMEELFLYDLKNSDNEMYELNINKKVVQISLEFFDTDKN